MNPNNANDQTMQVPYAEVSHTSASLLEQRLNLNIQEFLVRKNFL